MSEDRRDPKTIEAEAQRLKEFVKELFPVQLDKFCRRIPLRGPEMCSECGHVYLSLHRLIGCEEHVGLDEI